MINIFPWLRKIYAKDSLTGKYLTDEKGEKIITSEKWQLGYESYELKNNVQVKVRKNISINKVDPLLPNTKSGALKALKMFNPPGVIKARTHNYFSELANDVLGEIKACNRTTTYECYKLSIQYFLELVGDKSIKLYLYKDIVKFKNLRSESFIKSIKRKDTKKRMASASSINIDLRNIKHIFQQAVDGYKLIDENPCAKVAFIPVGKNLKTSFTNPQLQQVLPALRSIDSKFAVYSIHSGCRISEVLFAEESDMQFDNDMTLEKLIALKNSDPDNWTNLVQNITGFIQVMNKPYFKIKDHEERRIPMSTEIINLLVELKEEKGNVHNIIEYTDDKGSVHNIVGNIWNRLYRRDTVSHEVTAVLRKLGYSNKYTFHSFRHTAITNWLKAGIPVSQVQLWAGHASSDTTTLYTHMDDSEFVDKVKGIKYGE